MEVCCVRPAPGETPSFVAPLFKKKWWCPPFPQEERVLYPEGATTPLGLGCFPTIRGGLFHHLGVVREIWARVFFRTRPFFGGEKPPPKIPHPYSLGKRGPQGFFSLMGALFNPLKMEVGPRLQECFWGGAPHPVCVSPRWEIFFRVPGIPETACKKLEAFLGTLGA